MKSPLRKLKKFGLHKTEPEENSLQFVSAHIDGLNQAAKDVENMKTCYDGLLAAAAATVNSAYEFSQSLQDMGNSLLEKTVMHDDGEAGEALSRLGRIQLELPKLLDCYRSQIISTVTNPSDSLLTELRKVEEMISQCDEKRDLFEHIVGQLREKGKAKHGKVDALTSDQLKAIREEYDETARLCIFRVQSLKKGQCRSLLTLAAHHHAAQLNFFRKGLRSLVAVDTHIRSVAETLHIDYQLSESNFREECGDVGYIVEASGDGELSYDHSMSVETEAEASRFRKGRSSMGKSHGEPMFTQQQNAGSYSAPLFSEKFDPAERLREMKPSAQKFNTHVLPTPDDARGSSTTSTSQSCNMLTGGGSSKNLWHSSPLGIDKQKKSVNESTSSRYFPKPRISTEEKNSKHLLPLPLPLNEAASSMQVDSLSIYDGHKSKRPAFSEPLASKSLSRKPFVAVGGPQTLPSLSMSNNAPPIASSPRVSELHELPRPPDFLFSKPVHSARGRRHSAPIVDKDREISVSVSPPSRNTLLSSNEGSPLLLPKLTVSRSFSNPSSFSRTIFNSGKLFQSSQAMQMTEVASSTSSVTHLPPPNLKPLNSTQQIRGGS